MEMTRTEMKKLFRRRSPLAVVLLSVITLGVYFVYWYYKVNKEIAAYDEKIETSPGVSAFAITLGYFLAFFIVGFISSYNTAARAKRMFHDFNTPISISPIFATLLYALSALGFPMLALFYPAYIQSKLNAFWRHESARMKAAAEERPAA
ncbi:MAG: DUF4234 domain-containing protein [Actinobacteria bacterium]|nr:DUF4234 domain-containing protein [Actinomycetota bacterium]